MLERPASIRDIARASGFSKSAVAAVLNNSPSFRPKTRAAILAAAGKLGYRRDPVVADLAARRWRSRKHATPPTLAYVYDHGLEVVRSIEPTPVLEQTADRYGYHLEVVNLKDFESDARASTALYYRGYRGLLVGRILRRDRPLELDWARFTAVSCDLGSVAPPLHTVVLDHFAAAEIATRTAIERGYRRPGYVHLRHNNREAIDPCRLGGYLAARSCLPPADHLPAYVGLFETARDAAFEAWLLDSRPDVVIGFNNLVACWLCRAGVRLPQDMGFISLERSSSDKINAAGVAGSKAPVDAAAVELLVGQIHVNACGIPNPQHTLLVRPPWHEGLTLPSARGAPAPRATCSAPPSCRLRRTPVSMSR